MPARQAPSTATKQSSEVSISSPTAPSRPTVSRKQAAACSDRAHSSPTRISSRSPARTLTTPLPVAAFSSSPGTVESSLIAACSRALAHAPPGDEVQRVAERLGHEPDRAEAGLFHQAHQLLGQQDLARPAHVLKAGHRTTQVGARI